MSKVKSMKAREILDSRGNPTVEVELETEAGSRVRAGVPSGASTGVHEALELRDGGERFGGKGVRKAVENVNGVIREKVVGSEVTEQEGLDRMMIELDGTENKSKLGANAMLGVSLALVRAGAEDKGVSLWEYFAELKGDREGVKMPVPCLNVINGGEHADNNLDIQEFMLVPMGFASFAEALRAGAEIYQILKKDLQGKGLSTAVGDEGGFAPRLGSHREALEILVGAINEAGYEGKVGLALDAAATEFYKGGEYVFEGKGRTAAELTEYYVGLTKEFPLVSIEDGYAEDDSEGWREGRKALEGRVQLVGDDLLVTNPERIRWARDEKLCTAALIKLNQIGTVTETIEAVKLAEEAGWRCMISHRSGETEDTTIADVVVGLGTGQIKSGAPCRGERLGKYNQLLRIEEELGGRFVGAEAFGD